MSAKKPKNHLILYGIGFLFLLGFAYFGKPMFAPRIENKDSQVHFWETSLSDGQLQALGLTLMKDDAEKAIAELGNRFEFAIFEDPKTEQNNQTLELYFRETEVGGFTGRVIASLAATPDQLKVLMIEANPPKALPDRRLRYPLSEHQKDKALHFKITHLAFIPTAISLDEEIILKRFGAPEKIIKEPNQDGDITHYLYPKKGIEVSIDTQNRTLIQYLAPNVFNEKITQPLLNLTNTQ